MTTALKAVDLARLRSWVSTGKARQIREAARLSRSDVARAVGVHEMTVTRWELGQRTPCALAAEKYYELLDALRAEYL